MGPELDTVTQPTEPESPKLLSERLKPEHEVADAEGGNPRVKANARAPKVHFEREPNRMGTLLSS